MIKAPLNRHLGESTSTYYEWDQKILNCKDIVSVQTRQIQWKSLFIIPYIEANCV